MSADARVSRALFRSFARTLRGCGPVSIVEPLDLNAWKNSLRPYRFIEHRPGRVLSDVMMEPRAEELVGDDGCVEPAALLEAIKREFRAASGPNDTAIERGFACLRLLNEMLAKRRHKRVLRSGPVEVEMCTTHVPGSRYRFVYRARIRSLLQEGQVQLRTRHICVRFGGAASGFGDLEGQHGLQSGSIETPVDAPGVVGQQPVLGPGQTFEYHSWTSVLPHFCGSVSGSYGLVDLRSGEPFDADIPATGFDDPDAAEHFAELLRARDAEAAGAVAASSRV